MDLTQKIAPSVAMSEVERFLDYKKILPRKRKNLVNAIEEIEEAVVYGIISIDENMVITQTLLDPIRNADGNVAVDKLLYKPRLDPVEVSRRLEAVKPGSNSSVLTVMYASIATGEAEGIIKKLEQSDKEICDAIVSFFL